MEPFCGVSSEKDLEMSSSESDSESYWNAQLINAIRKKQRKGKRINEEHRIREVLEALEQGADVDTTDSKNGNTALHIAVRNGFHEIVKFLRQKGARTDISNLKGETAVTLAKNRGMNEIVSILQDWLPQRSESGDHGSIRTSDVSILTDNQRPSTLRDSADVSRRNHPSRDDDKINVNPDGAEETYDCEPGPALGFEYQWTHLAFILQRALQQKDSQFYLAIEMVAARKLDDVFLEYTNHKGERVGRFMQVKHISNKRIIFAESLLAASGKFSVSDYFKSWRAVAKDPVFDGIDKKDIILCTNANVSLADLERNDIKYSEAKDPDESFELVSRVKETAWYKLEAKQERNVRLYSNLKATSNIYGLAMRLAEYIYLGKAVFLNIDTFQYYHLALAKVIFDRENNKFQFRPEFIEDRGLSVNVKKFREIFLSKYRLRMNIQEDTEKPGLFDDLVWQDIVKRLGKLNFCAGFGKPPTFEKDPQLTDVPELSDRIVELLKNASKDNEVIIVDRAKPNKVIWDNIHRLSGHVLIKQGDIIKFSRRFVINSQKSEGNIGEFRTAILSKLGEGYDLAFFAFKIQKSGICTEAALLAKDEMPEDDTVDDEEISRFLNEFTLAVNQPDLDELYDLIGENMHTMTRSFNIHNVKLLGDTFRTKLSRWFVKKRKKQGKEQKYLTYNVAREILDEMIGEVVSIRSSGITLMYCERMKPNDVHFKSGMQPVEAFLSEGESGTISERMLEIVAPQNTLLTALRLYDTLRKMPEYQKLDNFILTSVDTLQLASVRNTIMAALELPGYPDLLIVDCGSYSADKYSRELWNPLCEVLKRHDNKKIILITQKDKSLNKQFENGHKTHEDDHNFQNLTDDTQKKLLEKPVTNFQGHKTKISFGELLGIHGSSNIREDESQDLSEVIDSNTLIELICKDEIRICNDLETLNEKDYYIHRTICRQVIIKKDVLKDEKIPDLFAIQDSHGKLLSMLAETTEELSPTSKDPPRITVLAETREEEEFKALCEKYDRFNIHWLNLVSGKYIWEKSKGDITHLLEYRVSGESNDLYDGNTHSTCFTDMNNFNRCEGDDHGNTTHATRLTIEDDQMASHEEPAIFSSTAGMGKTTMLTYLACQLKERDPNMLVIKVNLISHVQAFAKLQGKSTLSDYNICVENGAIDFLVKELLKHETELARKVIRRMIKNRCKVALILDGFDEISPIYEETVSSLLETLARDCIKKLIVATRPHTRKALETKLKVFSYDLQPFQPKNCEEFFNTFFKNDKARIEIAQAVLKKLGKSIDDQTNGFTGIPLHTKMIAEILQNAKPGHLKSFGRFADVHDGEPKVPEEIDLIYLYTYFVEMKFDSVFNRRGANLADIDVINQRRFEFKEFTETHTKLALDALFDEDKVKEFPPLKIDPKIAVERNGIITQFNDNGRPQFGNRTYAEYFAAIYVVDIVKTGNLNEKVQRIFLKDILVGDNYQTMRAFINCLWAEEHVNVFGVGFGDFCLDEYRGSHGRTIFHVAADEGNGRIIQHFLKHFDLNFRNKKALSIAEELPAESGLLNVLEMRNENKDAKVDLTNNDGKMLGEALTPTDNIDNVKNLSHKGLAIVDTPDNDGRTPLSIAASTCQLLVVKHLCDKGANVHSEDKNGLTPLHHAAFGGKLDVVEYLFSKGANVNYESKDGLTPLHAAAGKGHLDVVEYLLSKGANVNSENRYGRTPLHLDAVEGKLDDVKYLFSKGANVNSQCKDAWTPLHLAAHVGRLDVVEYLLSKGANVNYESKDGLTPLHAAAGKGHLDVVKYLLSKGAYVNSESKDGVTPQHTAAGEGHLNVVQYLLSKGANVNSESKDGVTSLHTAAGEGHLNIVGYLLSKEANVNSQCKDGRTPLHAAAGKGHLDLVEYLLSKGANVNSESKDGITPQHTAAGEGHLNVVQYLLSKGANVNSEGKDGMTSLHTAAGEGHLNVVQYLLSKGANVNSESKDGLTPLHAAAGRGHLNVVKYLLSKGANVNSETKDDVTPQHTAAAEGHLNVVQYLLSKGANVNSESKDGMTSLHTAAEEGHLNVIQYLLSKGANVNSESKDRLTPLHAAAGKGHLNVVQYLLSKGANVNSESRDGLTPLHVAAQEAELDVVKYLTSLGANIDSEAQNGETPLHHAAQSGKLDVVKYLTSQCANINSKAKNGETPLHHAAQSGKLDVVKYLTSRGANINSRAKNGETPLHHAAQSGKLDVVKYLTSRGASIESETEDNETPLHRAAEYGNLNVVEYLIHKGANIESETKDDETPLHHAARSGKLDVVEFLTRKGADIDSQTSDNETPLHLAVRNSEQHLDIAKHLIEKGANLESRTGNCWTTLHLAAAVGNLNMVQFLIEKGANVDSQEEDGWTPLHLAARFGHLEVVRKLLKKTSDIEHRQNTGETPLHLAAISGEKEVVEYLHKEGAKIESHNHHRCTPLHVATEFGNLAVVEYLVEAKANIESKNEYGYTPLHVAAEFGKEEVVEYLHQKGANIESQNQHRCTPLHVAAEYGNEAVVKYLVEAGAKIRSLNDCCCTPLDVAAENGNLNVLKYFTSSSNDTLFCQR